MAVIEIDLKNKAKLRYLIELLKSLDFVESVRVRETGQKPDSGKSGSFFDKYNGCLPGLDIKSFEQYITDSRNQWESPHF